MNILSLPFLPFRDFLNITHEVIYQPWGGEGALIGVVVYQKGVTCYAGYPKCWGLLFVFGTFFNVDTAI